MTTTKRLAALVASGPIFGLALFAFALWTWTSAARWANFEYRTFDLAYYVQAVWQLIHGRFQVSVEGVPLLGNHVEPIVFLFAPLFAIFPHPLVFVVAQNVGLASMGPVAFDIGRRLGLDRKAALLLAGALLVAPPASYIALHEFHPEALAAPFLLLMLRSRLRHSLRAHWGWLLAVLACKENMALLVMAYCAVHVAIERKRPLAELRAWYLWPMSLSIVWFVVCTNLITPLLNSGNIDYLALYDRLGTSTGDILIKALTQPHRILGALGQSLMHGNLLWALLLPFIALPLLRPRWLLITTPILLQHLLSWRSSEWTIYFHYSAPLLPLFWFALAEVVVRISHWSSVPVPIKRSLPVFVVAACVAAQILLGPAREIVDTAVKWSSGKQNRIRKEAFVSQVPVDASVLAPLPYLSHLATREKVYSLHYVLKGLKTLSRAAYDPPPPTDFVLIDYDDSATFDPIAGYYHPAMKTVDGRVIPSSDRLLHEFLQRSSWTSRSSDELTILRQGKAPQETAPPLSPSLEDIAVMGGAVLMSVNKSGNDLTEQGLEITTLWNFQIQRDVFPWMFLKLTSRDHRNEIFISRGLCGPEAPGGSYLDRWHVTSSDRILDGDYGVEAVFVDNAKRVWAAKEGQRSMQPPPLAPPIYLGELRVVTDRNKALGN